MVKKQSRSITKDHASKGIREGSATHRKITASTLYGTCTEQLSPFGGLLGLIKFWTCCSLKRLRSRKSRQNFSPCCVRDGFSVTCLLT
jgi:hypothetical protein